MFQKPHAEITEVAREQFFRWIIKQKRVPPSIEERRQLAEVYLAGLRDHLSSSAFISEHVPLGNRKFLIPIDGPLELLVEVKLPMSWQFWKRIQIKALRFRIYRP